MSQHIDGKIKDVYQENLVDELRKISELVETYNYISMDTEFPGIVYPLNANSAYSAKNIDKVINKDKLKIEGNPTGVDSNSNYKNIKNNVDNLKVIQVGITLVNENGEFPEEYSTWQFNFKFDLDRDIYLNESINLLEMAGINFKNFFNYGIDVDQFGELFTTSGLILNENVKWITFHGSYDFAYLVKVLSNQFLPDDEIPFNELIAIYFPTFYDVRHLIKNATWIKGSLSRIANDLDIKIIGNSHQAGSDSLVTSKVFFKLIHDFGEQVDLINDRNKLFGFSYKIIEEYDYNFHMPVSGLSGLNNLGGLNNLSNINNFIGINNPIPAIPSISGSNPNNHIPNLNSNLSHIPGLGSKNLSNLNTSSSNKNGANSNIQNMMFYQNMNNNFMGYNGGSNIPINPLIYNNSNINNYSSIYPSYEYNNYFGGFYPGNGGSSTTKANTNGSSSSKDIRFNMNQI